uniref:Secreted protein n=1 Tax=Rhipicephalus zambeziensis TaxID=60191 RepID=A0A224Y6N4_9ACAR
MKASRFASSVCSIVFLASVMWRLIWQPDTVGAPAWCLVFAKRKVLLSYMEVFRSTTMQNLVLEQLYAWKVAAVNGLCRSIAWLHEPTRFSSFTALINTCLTMGVHICSVELATVLYCNGELICGCKVVSWFRVQYVASASIGWL